MISIPVQAMYEQDAVTIKAQVGDLSVFVAWEAGRALLLEEALAEALAATEAIAITEEGAS
ncbi:MAG: hypothetical protein H0V47_04900 [Chloroflexia bacterium]|nr:hypothetical protein [Chloroflexia bacterium]